MPVNFKIEIRDNHHGGQYLKVYLSDRNKNVEISKHLTSLKSVRCVNVSDTTAKPTLTVYPNETFTIEEVSHAVEQSLNIYFHGISSEEINETDKSLSVYSYAHKAYNDAMNKYMNGQYERNLLDDLRLALELFLREKLNNNKSLENQENELGKFLKNKGYSKEVRNMCVTLLNYYDKYQNEHVKHNYHSLQKSEIEFIVGVTNMFIKFLDN